MKYYIIAGEASGDLHGSNLIQGLRQTDPDPEIRFWGGDLMLKAGGDMVKHYKETAVMGFIEVLYKIKTIAKNLNFCKKDILSFNPDVVILIDYPGFNMRVAKFAKKNNFVVFYYIPPKVWAWKESRIELLKRYVDRLFIIFPFEVEYFKMHAIDPIYNGNPLVDKISEYKRTAVPRSQFLKDNNLPDKPIIALLTGSRKMEIEFLLPKLVKLERLLPEHLFLLAAAPSIEMEIYNQHLKNSNIRVLSNQTYSILSHAKASVISSGTASLEAALLKTPQVVCYGVNEISYQIAKYFVKAKYISLVNLILDYPCVKELLQRDCTVCNIKDELSILLGSLQKTKIMTDYDRLESIIGGEGASVKVAKSMYSELTNIRQATSNMTPQ